jgi:hypothetical protein
MIFCFYSFFDVFDKDKLQKYNGHEDEGKK